MKMKILKNKIVDTVNNAGNISEADLLEKVQDVEVVPCELFSIAIRRLLNDAVISEDIQFLTTDVSTVFKMKKTYSIHISEEKNEQ